MGKPLQGIEAAILKRGEKEPVLLEPNEMVIWH